MQLLFVLVAALATSANAQTKSGIFSNEVKEGPTKEDYNNGVRLLTLGDFGATLASQGGLDVGPDGKKIKPPSCGFAAGGAPGWGSRVNEKPEYVACGTQNWLRQWHAQKAIAFLMGKSAEKVKPQAVITQGDNFYWDGVANPKSELFNSVFEDVYTHPSLMNIPWVMCLGNHDIGGTAYICGQDPGTNEMNDVWHKKCESAQEATDAMWAYYKAQRDYVGKNNRWQFKGSYFKDSFKSPSGVTVEVYTIDTNVATTHGVKETCCQCFGYGSDIKETCAKGTNAAACDKCKNVEPGTPYCAPPDIYNACVNVVNQWFEESLEGLKKDLAASTATWKVVNTHYCPIRHFAAADEPYKKLLDVIKGKVNIFLCAHTHAGSHDYQNATGVHYIMDGAGGAITAESAATMKGENGYGAYTFWTQGGIYSFTEMFFGQKWAQVKFVTTDGSWSYTDLETFTPGGSMVVHNAHIPVNGGPPVKDSDAAKWKPQAAPTPGKTSGGTSAGGSGNSDSADDSANSETGTKKQSAAATASVPLISAVSCLLSLAYLTLV